ncbi:hypothetical protein ABZ135_02875 [Streptomyces sp. NPDC006339]|uniref:hypothetical protein n=1 Tax=Streptomyces sp. NPDC006339 TaxID=3156755 RepID=UPI0033A605D7
MRQHPRQHRARRISLTAAAAASAAAAAVFLTSGTGLAGNLGPTAPAAAEPTDGGDTVGVTVGTTAGESSTGTTSGGADGGADGGTTSGETTGGDTTGGESSGGTVGVSEGTTSGETTGGDTTGGESTGGTVGVSEGTTSGETSGGGDPTPSPTPTAPPTQPGTGPIPYTAHPCWSADSKPITGTFVALVPAGTLPSGNKATLVELTFTPWTDPRTGIRTDDEIVTRFATTGGAWTAARPAKLELDTTAVKPFRPVVDGTTLKMPEIRLTAITCWNDTVAALAGTLRFGGTGGNGGPEVKVPVTWQRS